MLHLTFTNLNLNFSISINYIGNPPIDPDNYLPALHIYFQIGFAKCFNHSIKHDADYNFKKGIYIKMYELLSQTEWNVLIVFVTSMIV